MASCRLTSRPSRTAVRSGTALMQCVFPPEGGAASSPTRSRGTRACGTPRRIMTRRVSHVLASIGAAIITYACARAGDALVRRVVHPPRGEVLLISDVILATAFGVVIYLWLNLRATRTRLTGLERDQIVLDTQLSLAARIQRHLLPSAPVESNGVRWAGRLEPAHRIGGDFYDFIPFDTDSLFVVGDVAGKGIPAGLLQASAHSIFRTVARETVHPAELLTRV